MVAKKRLDSFQLPFLGVEGLFSGKLNLLLDLGKGYTTFAVSLLWEFKSDPLNVPGIKIWGPKNCLPSPPTKIGSFQSPALSTAFSRWLLGRCFFCFPTSKKTITPPWRYKPSPQKSKVGVSRCPSHTSKVEFLQRSPRWSSKFVCFVHMSSKPYHPCMVSLQTFTVGDFGGMYGPVWYIYLHLGEFDGKCL